MFKKKQDVEKELAKYRFLINKGYVEDDKDDMEYDIIKFCAKKKLEKDIKFYGKVRNSYFDDFFNISLVKYSTITHKLKKLNKIINFFFVFFFFFFF